ncbi:hypothetical protein GOQ27_07240 [Clostridium sp. D2Q-11]|uniref:Zinc-ribbon 15 domain-containing protein n=1 Tax=Anaeromonas frigoriresistens TaxID=2683708 RepID=A0A942Z735_9FIRM|nr:hypothetical protein [Anaeromonas frigoriresistens]MBS4538252.1 hypothetical protein [Anaeromonas frigoriresistens]
MKEFYNKDHSKPTSQGTALINQIKESPLLDRINPTCEGCGQNHSYLIHKKKVYEGNKNFFRLLVPRKTRYYISCPQCSFVMELDYDEYQALKIIADQNQIRGKS